MADVTFTFSGDATSLQNALNEIKGEIGKTKESVQGLAGQFAASFAAIGAAIAAVKGAFATLGGISAEAAKMEQTGLAFKVMMGDAAAAAEYVEKLRVYAAETPFEFGDISDAGKTLLSMGTAAEKSIEVIRKLGDIASVSGKPLKELAFLYAKVQNSGLSNEVAESLEMQGVPIRKLIAEMKGISFEDVFKGISKRQFNLDDLDAALDKLTGPGGLLENMTKLQSQTFSGALSTLTDGFSALAVELGTPINAAILPVLADLTAYVDSLTPTIRQFAQTLATVFEGVVAVITPIVSGIGELVSLLGGAETVIASAAAAMLMYVGNTKTATTSTVSFRAQLVAMGNTIKGLSFSSFVTGYRTALAGVKTAMSSTLAGLKVTWSIAWTTMATITRTAMVAVKAAIVSTGIGIIIVAIGEALGALYSWFMGNSEAAERAAESAREFEKSLKNINKQAEKVKTHEQYEGFMEHLEERMEDLRAQRNMAVAKDEDEEVIKLLDQQLARLRERKRHYEETLPKQVEAAIAAERAAEAMRRQKEEAAELERKLAAAREKLNDLAQRQSETEREQYLSGIAPEVQIKLRLSDATAYGQTIHTIESLRKEMQDILNKPIITPEDTARYEKLASTYNKIVELQQRGREEAERTAETERRRAEEAAKQEQARQNATRDYDMAVKMLQAEIAGNEKRLEVLKQQQRITQLTAEYQRQGLEDAEARAKRMVALEKHLEDMQEKQEKREKQQQGRSRQSGTRITDSYASVGGGGRSVVIGGPLISETKKQTRLLEGIGTSVKKPPTVQVSGNVEAVISR
ncbi:MAG: hypothetical protein IJY72_00125 [Akkermansia sp.]|nr:hypothetical protein [Akkermansia sp.]